MQTLAYPIIPGCPLILVASSCSEPCFVVTPFQSVAGQSIHVEAAGFGASSKPNLSGSDSPIEGDKDGSEQHRSSDGDNERGGEEASGKNAEDKVEKKAGKKKGTDKGSAGGGVGYGSYGGFEGDYSGGGYSSYKKV